MPNYTVIIKIPNAENLEISHSVDLIDNYEDHPEDYFRSPENCFHLSQTIQNQSARQLSPEQLTRVIQEWIEEIKQGRRQITIILDLPSQGISASTPTIPNEINIKEKEEKLLNKIS